MTTTERDDWIVRQTLALERIAEALAAMQAYTDSLRQPLPTPVQVRPADETALIRTPLSQLKEWEDQDARASDPRQRLYQR